MAKASEVAIELRKLADALDREPDSDIERPYILFSHYTEEGKEKFKTLARLLPRPIEKNWEELPNGYLNLIYDTPAAYIKAYIPRSVVCTLVEPAKPAVYNCEPLLSIEEEAALGKF